ncbi:MAG TPA: glycine cleavage system aminomethyltransferase GcvT [candidate division Zixibacteria bacterium]|nr:glycine cleavage system aminomethyltransferase GcvT [candidate division Zixibacteria bacterium]
MSQNAEVTSIRKTALNRIHRHMGAKMVEFNGWDMPVEYPATATRKSGGLVAEHLAVRHSVGIFDVSHMGDIRLVGPQALAAVQRMTMNDASKLTIGQAQYSALLYPEGTFVDDVIVHRLGENDYLLVINAGTREKDYDWVSGQARGFDCVVQNLSDDYTQIAIQGPNAWRALQKLTDVDLTQIKFYWFTHGTVCGLPNTMIARTGYTAEDGFEIYVPADEGVSEMVWNAIMEAGEEFGLLPCGLGARNTLRLEGALSLYGHEISDSITALEAGLTRFLKFDKGYFTGREALEQQRADGLKRTLVGLEAIERGIPRDGYKVCDTEGNEIGFVTSGSPAPFLKKNIALAYVPPNFAAPDSVVAVEIRGQLVKCKVVAIPFYKRPKISK